jgi:VWFA-related protein
MKRQLVVIISGLLLAAAGVISSAAQEGDAGVYRVTARLVTVDAQVLDKKTGRAIPTLQAGDFQIYEDKAPQQISAFSQDELPLSVVLLFDLTDSVRPVLKPLAQGALQALEHLKPEDEVAVMTYAASTQLLQDFTADRGLAVAAIEKASSMKSGEAAFFNEGIFQAAAHLAKARSPLSRRVIIWLTDDIPNFPSDEIKARYGRSLGKNKLHSEKEAIEELWRTGTVVCTLLQLSRDSEDEFSRRISKAGETMLNAMLYPPGEVHKYARLTGGHVVESSRKNIDERLATLIDDIRMRYSIGYRPKGQKPRGRYCAIEVKLSPEARKAHMQAVVEARQGYYR